MISFDKIPVWVQVHDIPVRFLNHKVAEDLCEVVGSICRVDDVNEMDGGSVMRVRVLIDINTPLCRGETIFFFSGGTRLGFFQV